MKDDITKIPNFSVSITWDTRVNMNIASLGEVSQQSEAGLSDLWHGVLDTLVQQVHHVTATHQPANMIHVT